MHELGVTFHIMDHLEKVDSDRVLFTELLDMGCKKAASVR